MTCPAAILNIDNMTNLLNIEKSFFRPNQYVGYGGGSTWRIVRDGTVWLAIEQNGNRSLVSFTLNELSEKLELI